ncbi:hypothetical protein Cgig2_019611 [Carnegiea gigantea]|uniref:fructose-bisphosphate aldolase n=1 Tax=Carnegiea gigantea TaxID=171969 RepID=A0A9Q1KHK8_9CARY|nr:hypothetical protein Cgig2_019611 [Carnegiea gigantea]
MMKEKEGRAAVVMMEEDGAAAALRVLRVEQRRRESSVKRASCKSREVHVMINALVLARSFEVNVHGSALLCKILRLFLAHDGDYVFAAALYAAPAATACLLQTVLIVWMSTDQPFMFRLMKAYSCENPQRTVCSCCQGSCLGSCSLCWPSLRTRPPLNRLLLTSSSSSKRESLLLSLEVGNQKLEAILKLNAMNQAPKPWHVPFSYAIALQNTCLKTWGGKLENVQAAQEALLVRAKANSLAQLGNYSSEGPKASLRRPRKAWSSKATYTKLGLVPECRGKIRMLF